MIPWLLAAFFSILSVTIHILLGGFRGLLLWEINYYSQEEKKRAMLWKAVLVSWMLIYFLTPVVSAPPISSSSLLWASSHLCFAASGSWKIQLHSSYFFFICLYIYHVPMHVYIYVCVCVCVLSKPVVCKKWFEPASPCPLSDCTPQHSHSCELWSLSIFLLSPGDPFSSSKSRTFIIEGTQYPRPDHWPLCPSCILWDSVFIYTTLFPPPW